MAAKQGRQIFELNKKWLEARTEGIGAGMSNDLGASTAADPREQPSLSRPQNGLPEATW